MTGEMPEWLQQLPAVLAEAMTLLRLSEFDRAAEIVGPLLGNHPDRQYAACCLLARMIAAKAPQCPGDHDGPCGYTAMVLDPETGERKEWDDVDKPQLFAIQFVVAMLHLDANRGRELYLGAVQDGSLIDGFMQLLGRAAQTVDEESRQSIIWQ